MSRRRPTVVRAVVTMFVVYVLASSVWTIVRRQTSEARLVQSRAGQVWFLTLPADLEWLQSATIPGERVFLFPDKGGFHFLTGTRNATTFPL